MYITCSFIAHINSNNCVLLFSDRLQRPYGGTISPRLLSSWTLFSSFWERRTTRFPFCMCTIMPPCSQSGGLGWSGWLADNVSLYCIVFEHCAVVFPCMKAACTLSSQWGSPSIPFLFFCFFLRKTGILCLCQTPILSMGVWQLKRPVEITLYNIAVCSFLWSYDQLLHPCHHVHILWHCCPGPRVPEVSVVEEIPDKAPACKCICQRFDGSGGGGVTLQLQFPCSEQQ